MGFLTAGLGVGYLVMSMIKPGTFTGTTGIVIAVAITMLASFFVQSGEGATFALVPLVKRRVTGQVAGLVGAYGNVGAVTYLTIFQPSADVDGRWRRTNSRGDRCFQQRLLSDPGCRWSDRRLLLLLLPQGTQRVLR